MYMKGAKFPPNNFFQKLPDSTSWASKFTSAFTLPFTGIRTFNEEKVRPVPHVLEQTDAAPQVILRESVVQVFYDFHKIFSQFQGLVLGT